MKTICLSMIVRNEEKIIQRCLESVKKYISHWVVCDTGSTDRTCELVMESLGTIPGSLYKDLWQDFSHNRNVALQRSLGKSDYVLLIDADMVLNTEEDFRVNLVADAYHLRFNGVLDYSVVRLVSSEQCWIYSGTVHELISSPTAAPSVNLPSVSITHFEDGGYRFGKYERDIEMLNRELDKNPNNSRAMFYLAQSRRDQGDYESALKAYEKRVGMGGWIEETWYALYQLGRMQEMIIPDLRVAHCTHLQAYNLRPTRLEPIYRIARFYREHRQWALGYLFARLVTEVGYPDDILFVERAVYEHLLAEEYMICCRETGRKKEALRVEEILKCKGHLTSGPPEGLKQETSSVSSPVCAA